MSKMADQLNFLVFGAKHQEAIRVPEMPIAVRIR